MFSGWEERFARGAVRKARAFAMQAPPRGKELLCAEHCAPLNLKGKGGLDGSSILPTSTTWRRKAASHLRRRHLPGVIWFRQAAQVAGDTARQASDVNSANTINVNNVYAKGVNIGAKYAGFPTNGNRYQMAA